MILSDKEIIDNLTYGSKYRIDIRCDYCNKDFQREYRRYNESVNNTNRDFCKSCVKYKNIHLFLLKINYHEHEKLVDYMIDNKKYLISGVYSIKNKLNNKIYIGSSKDIIKRWNSHLIEIDTGNHYIKDFRNIDINSLEFKLLEVIDGNENLLNREFSIIESIKSENPELIYNVMIKKKDIKYSDKSEMSLEDRLKRSKYSLNTIKSVKIDLYNEVRMKDIAEKYNVNYNFVQEVKSCKVWDMILPELNEKLLAFKYEDARKGTNNSCSKLTENDVKKIKLLLKDGTITKTDIGKMFGVSRTLVNHIENGKLWSFVS